MSKKLKNISLLLAMIGASLLQNTYAAEENTMSKQSIERKYYKQLGEPVGPYAHAVRHKDTLYVSGLTAMGSSAQKGTITEQAKVIFDQIHAITQSEGVTLDSLIRITIYVTHWRDIDQLRALLYQQYGSNFPASSLIQVQGLFSPDLQIEIETIFAL